MSYYNTGTPKFYVDHLLWYKSFGMGAFLNNPDVEGLVPQDIWTLNPSKTTHNLSQDGAMIEPISIEDGEETGLEWKYGYIFKTPTIFDVNYVALLGHDLASSPAWQPGASFMNVIGFSTGGASINYAYDYSITNSVNLGQETSSRRMESLSYDGYTLWEFEAPPAGTNIINMLTLGIGALGSSDMWLPINLGALSIGTTFKMPHAPDLSLTLGYEYTGNKSVQTLGGTTISNTYWTRPSPWVNNLGAFELQEPLDAGGYNKKLARSGRRTWDLSFSFLDDKNVFGPNHSLSFTANAEGIDASKPPSSDYDADGDIVTGNAMRTNLLTDDNFYSSVIHKTNGGALPFIFQPDSNDNTNFALARFDMNTFQFKQVAHRAYNVSVKIVETW